MRARKTQRHFLLMEVVIAFTLVILCIIPLIAPHTFILKEQRKFIYQIDLDHFVNIFYAEFVEKMYRGQVDWNTLVSGAKNQIEHPLLEKIPNPEGGKYAASYWFEEIRKKPPKKAPRMFYVFRLHLLIEPEGSIEPSEDNKNALRYYYDLFVVKENPEIQKPSPAPQP